MTVLCQSSLNLSPILVNLVLSLHSGSVGGGPPELFPSCRLSPARRRRRRGGPRPWVCPGRVSPPGAGAGRGGRAPLTSAAGAIFVGPTRWQHLLLVSDNAGGAAVRRARRVPPTDNTLGSFIARRRAAWLFGSAATNRAVMTATAVAAEAVAVAVVMVAIVAQWCHAGAAPWLASVTAGVAAVVIGR